MENYPIDDFMKLVGKEADKTEATTPLVVAEDIYSSDYTRVLLRSNYPVAKINRKMMKLLEEEEIASVFVREMPDSDLIEDENTAEEDYRFAMRVKNKLEATVKDLAGSLKPDCDNPADALFQENIDKVEKSVEDALKQIMDNPHAMLHMGRLYSKEKYTYRHSGNVAYLALNYAVKNRGDINRILLDQKKGLRAYGETAGLTDLVPAGITAMMHDISKYLPRYKGIINLDRKLTKEEYDAVKKTP